MGIGLGVWVEALARVPGRSFAAAVVDEVDEVDIVGIAVAEAVRAATMA